MDQTERVRDGSPELDGSGHTLDSRWWRRELVRQERSFGWLGRHTNRSGSAVARYASGTLPAPSDWLDDVARVLGVERAS